MYLSLLARRFAGVALLAFVFCFSPTIAYAETSISSTRDGVAIDGYDAVAYFKHGKPTLGSDEFAYSWQGAKWHFANAQNRDAFAADPAQYAPQYGGYCAYAMSGGGFAAGDGERWKIVDNKLYLNNNWLAQKLWDQDNAGYIRDSDKRWPTVQSKIEPVKP